MISAIVTIPPYASFIEEVAQHPVVSGLRLNTVMPTKGSLDELLIRLKDQAGDKDLFVDLKARQLRTVGYGVPPFTEIEVSHNIAVETPVKVYFNDGECEATLLEVDGNRLILQEGPRRVVGPGESLNILHPSLSIDGFLTDLDKRYLDAGHNVGVYDYMLSFVEGKEDVLAFKKWHPDARLVAKIESPKGLQYVRETWDCDARLMLARGDLYVEVELPHEIIQASEDIVRKDPSAIAASRILGSLAYNLTPTCADINDVDNLMHMGYKTLMLGDQVCQKRESVMSALNVLQIMAERYQE